MCLDHVSRKHDGALISIIHVAFLVFSLSSMNFSSGFSRLHLNERHMNHECLKELWITDNPEQSYLVDAIVRLWSEAQPNFQEKCSAMG